MKLIILLLMYYFLIVYICFFGVIGNKVTKETLKNLDEQLIKDLIPLIGDRSIFLSYWKQNYKDLCEENSNSTYKKIVNHLIIFININ